MRHALKDILSQRQRLTLNQPGMIPAAVLIPFFEKGGCYHMLLTKRTQHVAHHKGQICFPGGTCQPQDQTPLTTALREGFEEVGLRANDVEIIGQIDDTATVSTNFIITPFVALIPCPYPFVINSEEIDELIEIPLSALLDPANFRQEPTDSYIPACSYIYKGNIIWGATARILRQLLNLLPGQENVTAPVTVKGHPGTG